MTYHNGVLYWREHVSELGEGAILALDPDRGLVTELVRADSLTGVEIVGDSIRVGIFEDDVAIPHELVNGTFVRIERPTGSVIAAEASWEVYGEWREGGFTNLTVWWADGRTEGLLDGSDLQERGPPTTIGSREYDDGGQEILVVWCAEGGCDVVSYDVVTGEHEALVTMDDAPVGLSAEDHLMTYMIRNEWGRYDMLAVDLETGDTTTLGGRADAAIMYAWQDGTTVYWYQEAAPWGTDGPTKAFHSMDVSDATTCSWSIEAAGTSWSAIATDEDGAYVGLVTDRYEPTSSIYRLPLATPC